MHRRAVLASTPEGVGLALRERAFIYAVPNGKPDEGMLAEMVAHVSKLPELRGFDAYEILSILEDDRTSFIDLTAGTIAQRVQRAVAFCRSRGINELIIASPASDANAFVREERKLAWGGKLGSFKLSTITV